MNQKSRAAQKPASRWWNPGWGWKAWAVVIAMVLPTFGLAVWVLAEAGGQSKIDPELVGLAGENSGGPVTAITGTEHTVYHSNQPLPSEATPREDERLTLVWFTTTSCAACDEQLFAHRVLAEFDEVMFAEKDTGREPAAARLGVTKTPTFVWLDGQGKELGRFESIADEAALRAVIEEKLAGR
jgi:hypothetical protein